MAHCIVARRETVVSDVNAPRIGSQLRRESLVFAAIFAITLFGLSLVLITWRAEQLLMQLAQDRVTRLALQVTEEAERSMRFGVGIAEQSTLPDRLLRLPFEEPMVHAAWIFDERDQPLTRMGDNSLLSSLEPHWGEALLRDRAASGKQTSSIRSTPRTTLVGTTMADSTGTPVATLWIAFDPTSMRQQARDAALGILVRSVPLAVLTFFLVWWSLQRWSSRMLASVRNRSTETSAGRGYRAVMVACIVVLVIAPVCMVWIAREATRPFVTQQIQDNADATGRALSAQIAHAIQLGIPWEQVVGVQDLFKQQLDRAPELSYIDLRQGDTASPRITWSGQYDAAADLAHREFPVARDMGHVVVGYSLDFVNGQLRGMILDLVLALVISTVLMRELMRGLWRRSLLFPLFNFAKARVWQHVQRIWSRKHRVSANGAAHNDQNAQECLGQLERAMTRDPAASSSASSRDTWVSRQLTLLRLTVFLVALSEELMRPFFTVFASELQSADSRLSPAMVAGMPVAAFMATLALAQIAGPTLARRFDLRWGLILAALTGTFALACTPLASDIYALVGLRALAGSAYGLGLIIVQTAIVRITPPQQRARGLAEISAAIVAAGIVGPPFGGMIAARAGDVAGFTACALCMAAVMFVALRLSLRRTPNDAAQAGLATTGGWRGYMAVLREPRAIFVILGAALPARLVAVTVLSVVVPLYMSALHQPPAVAGRVLLLYFLCFASCSTLVAHWSDLTGQRKSFIVAGGVLSVLACLSLPILGGVAGMAMCCALLGFGQALQSSPQIALATEVFEPRPDTPPSAATPEQALAAFRFIERAGSILAPFITAVAITLFGYAGAVVAVGMLVGIATLGLVVGLRAPRAEPKPA